jgi:hypothetical protein
MKLSGRLKQQTKLISTSLYENTKQRYITSLVAASFINAKRGLKLGQCDEESTELALFRIIAKLKFAFVHFVKKMQPFENKFLLQLKIWITTLGIQKCSLG